MLSHYGWPYNYYLSQSDGNLIVTENDSELSGNIQSLPLGNNMNAGISKDFITPLLKETIESELGYLGRFSHVEALPNEKKNITDATTKFFIYNKNSKIVAFLLCGYSELGDICSRNLKKNREIKSYLGKELGTTLLSPIVAGEIDGIEYSIWPYCYPLKSDAGIIRRKLQLLQVTPLILNWLKKVNAYSIANASKQEILDDFIRPLQRLMDNTNINTKIRDEICWQVDCLASGSWTPYFILAHNDLWKGNILINRNNIENEFHGLTIIDWAGSGYRSYAIYDLVRISISLKVSRAVFSKELLAHCAILQCDKRNAMGYLLASFAFLADNLGQFPEDRFIKLLDNCFSFLVKK